MRKLNVKQHHKKKKNLGQYRPPQQLRGLEAGTPKAWFTSSERKANPQNFFILRRTEKKSKTFTFAISYFPLTLFLKNGSKVVPEDILQKSNAGGQTPGI